MLRIVPLGQNKLSTHRIAILLPEEHIQKDKVIEHYADPLMQTGSHTLDDMVAISIHRNDQKKSPVTLIRHYLEKFEKLIDKLGIQYLLIGDGSYFKVIAKQKKLEPCYGYEFDTPWPGVKAFVTANYSQLKYNPAIQVKMDLSLDALDRCMFHKKPRFKETVLVNPVLVKRDIERFKTSLNQAFKKPLLGCDIEAYSLQVNEAGLASIAFADTPENGWSLLMDNLWPGSKGTWANSQRMRLLKRFLNEYKGTLVYHNAPYDIKVLVWNLFMNHPMDIEGMLEGLDLLYDNMDDTKVLAYIVENSTAGNRLSLKDVAYLHTGSYDLGEDIKNIRSLEPHKLLTYNLTDSAATVWAYNKYRPIVAADPELEDLYQNLFKPALKVITQMELVGMPMNMGEILGLKEDLDDIYAEHREAILNSPLMPGFHDYLRDDLAVQANKKLKKLRKTRADFADEEFNAGSPKQMRMLLFEYLGLPKQGKTPTGMPSVDGKTLKKLSKLATDPDAIELLNHIRDWVDVNKIISTFIPMFMNKTAPKLGWRFLMGSFNLGGTKSGRLSSSGLHQIPSTGTDYAAPVKHCFQAPPPDGDYDWLMVGADFSSLEDRISALQTKDPNKLKVYTDGYDGHCLRTYSYFKDQLPNIDPDDVNSINSIEKKYPKLRQDSKMPTFALTFLGTWRTLVKNGGFSRDDAMRIEDNYNELYKVAREWAKQKVREAQKLGYMRLAFGLRLQAPLLPNVILDTDRALPYQAEEEIKTIVNAATQSYGLLNTRAANEFMHRVWNSKWRYKVLPIAQIHDAQYFLIHKSMECIQWVNKNLIECMQWNQLPEIQHPTVGLEAQLEIYWPSWAYKLKIPNGADASEILDLIKKHKAQLKKDGVELPY